MSLILLRPYRADIYFRRQCPAAILKCLYGQETVAEKGPGCNKVNCNSFSCNITQKSHIIQMWLHIIMEIVVNHVGQTSVRQTFTWQLVNTLDKQSSSREGMCSGRQTGYMNHQMIWQRTVANGLISIQQLIEKCTGVWRIR